MIDTLLKSARPARDSPPDAVAPNTAEFEAPKLNDRMSIALDKLVLGPGTPSTIKYAFTAIALLLCAEVGCLNADCLTSNPERRFVKHKTNYDGAPWRNLPVGGCYFAAAGRSATNRNETVSSSNWK